MEDIKIKEILDGYTLTEMRIKKTNKKQQFDEEIMQHNIEDMLDIITFICRYKRKYIDWVPKEAYQQLNEHIRNKPGLIFEIADVLQIELRKKYPDIRDIIIKFIENRPSFINMVEFDNENDDIFIEKILDANPDVIKYRENLNINHYLDKKNREEKKRQEVDGKQNDIMSKLLRENEDLKRRISRLEREIFRSRQISKLDIKIQDYIEEIKTDPDRRIILDLDDLTSEEISYIYRNGYEKTVVSDFKSKRIGEKSILKKIEEQFPEKEETEVLKSQDEEERREGKELELEEYMQEDKKLDDVLEKIEQLEKIKENGNKSVEE